MKLKNKKNKINESTGTSPFSTCLQPIQRGFECIQPPHLRKPHILQLSAHLTPDWWTPMMIYDAVSGHARTIRSYLV